MTNTRLLIVFSSIGLGLLILYGLQSQIPAPPAGFEAAKDVPAIRHKEPAVPRPAPRELAQENGRQERLAKQQIRELQAGLVQRKKLEAIAKRTRGRWEEIRWRQEWKVKQLIQTNLGTFEAQRILALAEDDKELRCTFCDGEAELHLCTICDSKGVCPTCNGIGQERFEPGKPCITCEGRTSCFYCAGRKKMTCVFCEKGRITTITRWPTFKLELP
jgi:hypothetical protein